MIDWSCPNCSKSLALSDHLAGLPHTCPDCGEHFVVPETAVAAKPAPLPARPLGRPDLFRRPPPRSFPRPRATEGYKGVLVLVAGVAFLVAAAVGAYLLYDAVKTDVWIYVDNGGRQPLVVSIDRSERATVPAGSFLVVKCRSGERHVEVRRGGQTVFDEVKQLRKPDKKEPTRYLLNPEETNGYRTYEAEYGMSFKNLDAGIPRFPLLGGFGDGGVKSRYQELVNEPKLLDPGPWHEVGQCDFVLQREPQQVEGLIYEKRTVLARVDKRDYDFLREARRKDEPTVEDLDALEKVVERVMASTP